MPESLSERVRQLHRGVRGAAASLPAEHAALGERATAAADRLRALARAVEESEGEGDSWEEILARFEGLHWAVLRVSVLEEEPDEAGVAEEVEEALRLSARLEGVAGVRPDGDAAAP